MSHKFSQLFDAAFMGQNSVLESKVLYKGTYSWL